MDNGKMIKTVNVLDTLAKVLGGILRVFGIICIVFALLVIIFEESMFETGSFTLDLDYLKIHMAEDFVPDMGLMKIYACIGLLVGSAMCFVIFYITRLLRKIFAPMKDGRPFDGEAPAAIRRIAWATLAGGLVMQALGIVERFIVTRAYPMEEIFASAVVSRLEYVFTMDFGFVVGFIVLMLLSYVFAYGQSLQRESDETL